MERKKTWFLCSFACVLEAPTSVLNFYYFCLFFKEKQLLMSLFVTDAFSYQLFQFKALPSSSKLTKQCSTGKCFPIPVSPAIFPVLCCAFCLQLPLSPCENSRCLSTEMWKHFTQGLLPGWWQNINNTTRASWGWEQWSPPEFIQRLGLLQMDSFLRTSKVIAQVNWGWLYLWNPLRCIK